MCKITVQAKSGQKKRTQARVSSKSSLSKRKQSNKKSYIRVRKTKVETKPKKAPMKRLKPQTGTPLARIRDRCRLPNPISNVNTQTTQPVPALAHAIAIRQPLPSFDLNLISNPTHNPDFKALSSLPLRAISNATSTLYANTTLSAIPFSDINTVHLSNPVPESHLTKINSSSSNYLSDLLTASNLISSENTLISADQIPLTTPIPVDALSYVAAVYDQIFAPLVAGSTPILKEIRSVLIRKLLLDHATQELQTRSIFEFEQLHDFILEILRKTTLIP